ANLTLARMYGYDSVADLQAGMKSIGARLYVNPRRRAEFQLEIHQCGAVHRFESQVHRKDGSVIWISENARAAHDAKGALYYEGTVQDITERKQYEEELESMNKKLLEVSRLAGMAEVATGVLHNVGNVLNSVNVSASLVLEKLRQSKAPKLSKAAALLAGRNGDLANYLNHDPNGRKLPGYLAKLGEFLAAENADILREVEQLGRNIEHIKEVVAMQQSYAKVSGVFENLPADRLVEDAIAMNIGAFERHGVVVQRQFTPAPLVLVDRHKVLQILTNLLRNAKYALDDAGGIDKRIAISIAPSGDNKVCIDVTDNGVGISPENLTRIFGHGFTTKKDGHGFGLHSGANAAREIGGDLSVQSAGLGKGATFKLELPAASAIPRT
ncbi:MAG: ATP-binding protein, partial [Chthoniobacteraceae bacterium]